MYYFNYLFYLKNGYLWQIVELMGEEVGAALKVVVKRGKDSLETMAVVPEEANPELI